jgi:ABC-type multidrug transport system ATPase subunit
MWNNLILYHLMTQVKIATVITSLPAIHFFLAREAVEFSAALRLPRDTPLEVREQWVDSVLTMLELHPLANTMVGDALSGGMSFEQKKRLSIAVELAANPSILFLDEPTTGLDSRAAQVVIRCIRRVAASGRSIVCFLLHHLRWFSSHYRVFRSARSISLQLISSTPLIHYYC